MGFKAQAIFANNLDKMTLTDVEYETLTSLALVGLRLLTVKLKISSKICLNMAW
jgi:hypothetical protein